MIMEVLKSFGTLQSELEQARSSLKGVDENIKRLIGRDPSEIQVQRPGVVKRGPSNNNNTGANEDNNRRPQQQQQQRGDRAWFSQSSRRVYSTENDEPPAKKRSSVFNRLADRISDNANYEDEFDVKPNHRQMISKIIVTPKEVPSRQDALDAQSKDEKSKARNRRMFGALLGTLQKFQQEETKLKSKEEKRAQVEKKIEESEIREKAEIKKERQELFFNRKKKQAEIKMIELKMTRMKEYSQWEDLQKPRMNFIITNTKPHIQYLPRRLNEANIEALKASKQVIEKLIDNKRQEVFNDLQEIEERMKRNFEPRKSKEEVVELLMEEDVEMPLDKAIKDEESANTCTDADNVPEDDDETLKSIKEDTNCTKIEDIITENNQEAAAATADITENADLSNEDII